MEAIDLAWPTPVNIPIKANVYVKNPLILLPISLDGGSRVRDLKVATVGRLLEKKGEPVKIQSMSWLHSWGEIGPLPSY